MKITDSPGALLGTPALGTDTFKRHELSALLQPAVLMAALPMLVTSNQSASRPTPLPLDHGATSETMMEPGGTAWVIVSVKFVLASGLPPTVTSSTFTVTL